MNSAMGRVATRGTGEMMMRHPFNWIFRRGVSATDIGFPIWQVFIALALHHTSDTVRHASPFYIKVERLAPLEAWELMSLALAIGVLVCSFTARPRALMVLYTTQAMWWGALGYINYTLTSSWLGPGFFGVWAVWSMIRQAQIGADVRIARLQRERAL